MRKSSKWFSEKILKILCCQFFQRRTEFKALCFECVFWSWIRFVYLIFGHFINVHFFLQPINNAGLPNNSNTY